MTNKIGFIPKTWPVQPDYYKQIFGNWNAVFLTEDDNEYHIELQSDYFNPSYAGEVEILRQDKDCRRPLFWGEKLKSIKAAYQKLLPLLPPPQTKRYVPYGINGEYFVYDNKYNNIPMGYGTGNTKRKIQQVCDNLNQSN